VSKRGVQGNLTIHRWPLIRFLNFRPVVCIGAVSYSLYLIHQVLL
jgi:peptidoglycan/LPS O-acetylase OafA/YrhL